MRDLLPRIEPLLVGLAREERRAESFAETVARVGAMPLNRFAREGQVLEVRVPWHAATLWFVPEERDAETLRRDGVSRGRVWTATELMDVMAISGRTGESLRTIALAKVTVDGDITAVIGTEMTRQHRAREEGPIGLRQLGDGGADLWETTGRSGLTCDRLRPAASPPAPSAPHSHRFSPAHSSCCGRLLDLGQGCLFPPKE